MDYPILAFLWMIFSTCCALALAPATDRPTVPRRNVMSRAGTHNTGTRNFGEQKIVFPQEDTVSFTPSLDFTGSPICASGSSKATFCETVADYPIDQIRRLIRIDKMAFQDIFGLPNGVNSRRTISNDDLSEESVCRHQPQTFFPKTAKNDQNHWRYVINDVDYVQAVVAEVCEKEGKACSYVQNSLPAGYQSICRQRYSYKRLLAIDPEEKKTYMDSFSFPSCCSCYVKVPALFERSGGRRPQNRTVIT